MDPDRTDSGQDDVTVDRNSPAERFELLADDIRVAILDALGETPDQSVSFSTLRKQVGTPDSGKFNYHLTKLQGVFVYKTEDGYTLTHAGRQVVGAIHAGRYTADGDIEPVPTGFECPMCETELRAGYTGETARLFCECDSGVGFFFPPGSLDQFDREELPTAFYRWNYQRFQRILAGFCPTCDGRMDGEMVLDDDTARATPLPNDSHESAHFEFVCRRCGNSATSLATSPAMLHPAVGGFLAEHGFDVRLDPIWWVRDELDARQVELRSVDPPRLSVQLRYDDEMVETILEEDATVETVERNPVEQA